MFRAAALVFKDGELVVRDGKVTHDRFGRALTVRPERDAAIDAAHARPITTSATGCRADFITVPEHAIGRPDPFGLVPCAR